MSPSRIAPWGALIPLALAGAAGAADISFFAPATPERPVIETLHGVTLTDRYRWLEDGKNAEVQAWTARSTPRHSNYLDRAAPPIAGMKDELTRYFDRNRTDAPFFKYGREFFKRVAKGEPQAKLYTRLDGKEVLLFDPSRSIRRGRRAWVRSSPIATDRNWRSASTRAAPRSRTSGSPIRAPARQSVH